MKFLIVEPSPLPILIPLRICLQSTLIYYILIEHVVFLSTEVNGMRLALLECIREEGRSMQAICEGPHPITTKLRLAEHRDQSAEMDSLDHTRSTLIQHMC